MALTDDLATNLQEDATRLSTAERTTMVANALKEMSSDAPRQIVRDFTGAAGGARIYNLVDSLTADPAVTGILADWDRGVSTMYAILDNDGTGNWEPIDYEFWRIEESKYGTTVEEWLPSLILTEDINDTRTLRAKFSKAWAESDPELDGRLYQAALELATAHAHAAIAAEYAAMTDATLEADSVDQGNLSSRHMDLHDMRRRNYRKLMGLQAADSGEGTKPMAASAHKDLYDGEPSYGFSLRRGYGR